MPRAAHVTTVDPQVEARRDATWSLRGRGPTLVSVGVFLLASALGVVVGLLGEPSSDPTVENEFQELGGGTGWTSLVGMLVVTALGWAAIGTILFRRLGRIRPWRVEIHNWIAIVALGLALFHGLELMALGDFRGYLSGWAAVLLMFLLFIHGWWRSFWVRRYGLRKWRIVHWEVAAGALLFTTLHVVLIDEGLGHVRF